MEPATVGYLVPGTHSFSFPASDGVALRVFVDTPDQVIAERLAGGAQPEHRVAEIILERLGTNPDVIRNQAALADFSIDGTATRAHQLRLFRAMVSSHFGLEVLRQDQD